MTRGKRIALAVFTVWPFLYIILFFGSILGTMILASVCNGPPKWLFGVMFVILILHFLTMIEVFSLIAIYIIHVFKTDRIPRDKKVLWAVVLFLGNMLAMPVYWYLYVWKDPETSASEQASAVEREGATGGL